jgi:hypothetical protein
MNNSVSLVTATKGNLPVRAKGSNVYTSSTNKKQAYNVKVGEIVAYDHKTGLTYDATDVASAKNLRIGVGVGKKVGGLAENIRLIHRDTLRFSDTGCQNYCWQDNVVAPVCAQSQILDIYFCEARCGETVSVTLEVDTPLLRRYMPYDERQKYTFTATPDCGCDTCGGKPNMDDVICELVDKINGGFRTQRYDQFFGGNDEGDLIQPFKAARLFVGTTTTKRYCLAAGNGSCDTCSVIDNLTSVEVDGVETVFEGVTASDTTMDMTNLDYVVEQLNTALKAKGGSAYLSRGLSTCCSVKLEVNTCAPFELKGKDGVTIAPCEETDPFPTLTLPNKGCVDCDTAVTTKKYQYGIRIFLDAVDLNIEQETLHNYPPATFYTDLHSRVELAGTKGFGCCPPVAHEVQAQVLSEGLGYIFASQELAQHNGGQGRNYVYDAPRTNPMGLPEKGTAYTSMTINPNTNYHVYSMVLKRTTDDHYEHGAAVRTYRDESKLLIPQEDTVTKASWDLFATALRAKF